MRADETTALPKTSTQWVVEVFVFVSAVASCAGCAGAVTHALTAY